MARKRIKDKATCSCILKFPEHYKYKKRVLRIAEYAKALFPLAGIEEQPPEGDQVYTYVVITLDP